jgi:hypothetical protein
LASELENTAELPVLDPAGGLDEPAEPAELAELAELAEPADPADAHHTETWIVSRAAPAALSGPATDEARARLETSLRKAYAQLRDAEGLLATSDERVRELQDALQEARETAAQQLAQLRAVHQEFAAATARQRAQLDAGQQAAAAAAAQRAHELSSELAQARGLLSAATAQAAQLQQALDAREAEGRVHESAALERRQALVTSERAHANALRELGAERDRNAAFMESLHRAASHGQISHSVVADLQHEVDENEASLQRLTQELASRDALAREQDAELARRAARIAMLEQHPASAAAPAAVLITQAPDLAPPEAGQAQVAAAAAAPAPETPPARQAEHDASATRVRELEADLRAAEDTIHRLESQARGRGARLEELEKANRQWRLTKEEGRATSTETGATNAALQTAFTPHETQARPDAHGAGHEPLPEGATRLLICKQKGREIVHVLGRKTSIGRTPDNDLQIDAKFISRHHAVILAGPVQTVIEDLNSTNGVLVNGQRVTRQMLKDGDAVVFGRAVYRLGVRRAGEKR